MSPRQGTHGRQVRTRLSALSIAVGVIALLGGCATNDAGTVGLIQVQAAPVEVPVPVPVPEPEPVVEAAPAPETQPIVIPRDSYAPEPIVELGTIEIPKIGLYHKIMQGVTLRNIDHGPAHWTGTALPGQIGNTVFAGHRVTRTHPFRNIHQLEPGDDVIFSIDGVVSVYKVTGNLIVGPEDSWIGDQTVDATGTLYACHPPGSAAYRYVVRMVLDSTTAA